jgi:hypothetical protein
VLCIHKTRTHALKQKERVGPFRDSSEVAFCGEIVAASCSRLFGLMHCACVRACVCARASSVLRLFAASTIRAGCGVSICYTVASQTDPFDDGVFLIDRHASNR